MPYKVKVFWKKNLEEAFVDKKYSRSHTWLFDGGIEIPASSSPHVVPLPLSNESAVDPRKHLSLRSRVVICYGFCPLLLRKTLLSKAMKIMP